MTTATVGPRRATCEIALIHPDDLDLTRFATAFAEAGIEARSADPFREPAADAESASVYLVEARRLLQLGGRDAIERALEGLHSVAGAATIVTGDAGEQHANWLAAHPHVCGWLTVPLDENALVAAVCNAARTVRARRVSQRQAIESDELIAIGLAFSGERDVEALQRLTVRKARELTNADSGSLFIVADGALKFAVAQTGPTDEGTHMGAVLPLSRASISGYVALTGDVVRLADAYQIDPDRDYRFNPSFDVNNEYRTKSVLCVPMRDHKGDVVGAIQLINRKPSFDLVLYSTQLTEEAVMDFTEHDEQLLLSLASQAGVALENRALVDSIQDLFEQFVRASVKAIEARDRATQGHSERVAELTIAQARAANAVAAGPLRDLHFDTEQIREMRYAALLHDFGKVSVPEYIFSKAKKLPDGKLDVIRMRFALAMEQASADGARRKIALLAKGATLGAPEIAAIDRQVESAHAELRQLFSKIESANEPAIVAEEIDEALREVIRHQYRSPDGNRALLEAAEHDFLRIPRGSLAPEERAKMQQHVEQSFRFLREIPWTRTPWQNVAEIAYGHHEQLDGSGYPRGLKGNEIVPQVRMMTIADVFDALTASDRPYKPALSVERALDILTKEFAERGKIDTELLDLFISKKVYQAIGV